MQKFRRGWSNSGRDGALGRRMKNDQPACDDSFCRIPLRKNQMAPRKARTPPRAQNAARQGKWGGVARALISLARHSASLCKLRYVASFARVGAVAGLPIPPWCRRQRTNRSGGARPYFPLRQPLSWPNGWTGYGARIATRDCIQLIAIRSRARSMRRSDGCACGLRSRALGRGIQTHDDCACGARGCASSGTSIRGAFAIAREPWSRRSFRCRSDFSPT